MLLGWSSLAGPSRTMTVTEDPENVWLRPTSKQIDPRVLLVLRRTSSLNRSLWFWTGAPCSPQRTWAENGFFQMLSLHVRRFLLFAVVFLPA
jgi:hypothetical protein